MATNHRTKCGQFSALESLEARLLLDSASVLVGQGENVSLAFRDADGSRVTVKVTRGLADVEVLGDGPVNAPPVVSGKVTATGTNLHLGKITMTQADVTTLLDIGVRGGNHEATLGEISAVGLDIGTVKAAGVRLADGVGLQAKSVASLRLAGVTEAAVTVTDSIGQFIVGPLYHATITADTGDRWQIKGPVHSTITVDTVDRLEFSREVDPSVIKVLVEARIVKFSRDVTDSTVEIARLTGSPRFGGRIVDSDLWPES